MRFDGKVAFVTGGASRPGAAAARPVSTAGARGAPGRGGGAAGRFSSEGARVVVADIDEQGARRVADELPDALAVGVDTADASSVQQAVRRAVDHYGRIDVVFNNAGIAGAQLPLHEVPVEDWQQVRGIDGDGIFYVMKYCIAEMLRTGGGAIVNTSSTAGLTGQQNISAYTFAKAGIIGLTRSAAIEYAASNIRVNAIAPTVVWTPLVERFAQTAPDPAAMRAAMENYNPMPGIPQAQDVAAVVAFLASDEARWITGHTLPIDGGYCAR